MSGTDILVMYTYGGDANLDGKINVDDYIRSTAASPPDLTGWSNGDFNYDGKVNIDDYTTSSTPTSATKVRPYGLAGKVPTRPVLLGQPFQHPRLQQTLRQRLRNIAPQRGKKFRRTVHLIDQAAGGVGSPQPFQNRLRMAGVERTA